MVEQLKYFYTLCFNKRKMTIRAQELLDVTMKLTLRPKQGDRQKLISCVIREVADRLCTDWGELQHPSTVLEEIADEIDAL